MAILREQQLDEAPRYNHPCGDLLESERRGDYINICVPLCRASIRGDLEAARVILKGREYLVRYSITEHKETPLHVAAAVNKPRFVKYLVDMMSEDDLELQNEEGNNAFCVAAIAGKHRMAMIMLQKNRQLLTIRGSGNMMPLYLAAYHSNRVTVSYLYDQSQRMSGDGWTDDDRNSVFLKCIEMNYFGGALRILNDREELPGDKYVSNVLHVLAQKADVFNPKSYFERVIFESEAAKDLVRKIWKKIVVKNKDEIDGILGGPAVKKVAEKDAAYHPCGILFVAAENGNTEFLVELFHEYPDLIRKTDDDGQTIFHIGLTHHHHGILNLLHEIGATKDTIAQLKDKYGNTLLHSVSKMTGRNAEDEIRAAPFQFLHRLHWFRVVRDTVPSSYEQLKNDDGQTPIEVFNDNHKDVIMKAEKWIKETSYQCMVVATLITTISFSAALIVASGYIQYTGIPRFFQRKSFMVFIVFDIISLILSSVSILLFLHSSFSCYCKYNSNNSHFKFAIGFLTLVYAIITLMVALSASFFVIFNNKLPIIMVSVASLPFITFFLMEVQMFTTDVLITISDKWLRKPMLYN